MMRIIDELFAAPACAGCRAPGTTWCARCSAVTARPRVRHLGVPVHALHDFSGPVRRCIIDWKDEHRRDARDHVVEWFREGLAPLLGARTVLVPVPPSPQGLRRRGEAVLADALSMAYPDLVEDSWLRSDRRRRDQSGLDRAARETNLRGSMRWEGPADRSIILVDDVLTTGATLRESVRAMTTAGAVPCAAFVIAQRERVDPVAAAVAGLRLSWNNDMGGFRGYQ